MSDAQSQSQSQSITINLSNSGDPELEGRILNGAYGVGRQLGALSAVVEVLLAQSAAGVQPPGASEAIMKFRDIQSAIAAEKRKRGPSRIVEQLQHGDVADAAESRELCQQLRAWLDDYEARLSNGAPDAHPPVQS
jgi:hypothetical protein